MEKKEYSKNGTKSLEADTDNLKNYFQDLTKNQWMSTWLDFRIATSDFLVCVCVLKDICSSYVISDPLLYFECMWEAYIDSLVS